MGFQPGNKLGGGSGRPKGPSALLRAYTYSEIVAVFNRLSKMSRREVYKLSEDGDAPALEAVISQVLMKAIEDGDVTRLGFLLNYMIGKPKEITGDEAKDRSEILDLVPKERLLLLMEK